MDGGAFGHALLLLALATETSAQSIPWPSVRNGYDVTTSAPLVDVAVYVGFVPNQVRSLDLMSGVVEVEAFFTLSWVDDRLAWDPNAYGGVTETSVPSSSAWLPEVELLNGFGRSLSDALSSRSLLVASTGEAMWARSGTLAASCSLAGLQNFPFDDVRCKLQFGSWTAREVNLTLGDDTAPWSAGMVPSAWHEYRLGTTTALRQVEARACCGGGDWPLVSYELMLHRENRFWLHKVILVNILSTYLSFGVFFTHPQAIQRGQFSITLLLTQTTGDVFVYTSLPRAPHFLWIEIFMLVSWCFCFLSTFENFVMLFIYWKSDPGWRHGKDACAEYASLKRCIQGKQVKENPRKLGSSSIQPAGPPALSPAPTPPRLSTVGTAAPRLQAFSDVERGIMSDRSGVPEDLHRSDGYNSTDGGSSSTNEQSDLRAKVKKRRPSLEFTQQTSSLDPVQGALVRQAFRLLDDNRNNLLGPEELEIFLHHMGNLSNYSTFSKSVYEDSWTVEDFSSLCLAALTKHGEQRFGILLKGLIDTRTDEHLVEKIAWQRLGVRVDVICQRIFPIAYALCLVALFSFELPDP